MLRKFDRKVLTIAALVVGLAGGGTLALGQDQDSHERRDDSSGGAPADRKKEREPKSDNLNQPPPKRSEDQIERPDEGRSKSEGLKQKQQENERNKAEGDKRKNLEEDRSNADAQQKQQEDERGRAKILKQKQLEDERGKAEADKRMKLEEDHSNAESQKQKQQEDERNKAEGDKRQNLEDRSKTEALKKQQEDERAKAEADKRKNLEEDRAKAETLKRQQEDERNKAEGDKRKNLEERSNADALKKQQENERTKENAEQQKLNQDKAKVEAAPTESGAKPEQLRQHREDADKDFEKAKAEAHEERKQAGGGAADEKRLDESEKKFEDLRRQRHERVEDGGRRVVIEEPGNRKIVRENGQTFIRHDESDRFQQSYGDVRKERRGDVNVSIFVRPGGTQIFTDYDDDGRPLRRYRRDADGREFVFFDNRDYYRRARRDTFLDAVIFLPPPLVRIPRERYIVDYDRASDDDIYDALSAPPVEHLERRYSLEEVRYSRDLRDRMPRVDLDTIHFDFGSWEVEPSQYELLERVARIINRIIERRPDEMFLIEGHTDAVGSEDDNLSLSDRRAEAVAEVLTREFQVPAENLSTQGYGKQFLKINTSGPERANRRVAIRRITPLLSRAEPRD